jgi:hypothetical protein
MVNAGRQLDFAILWRRPADSKTMEYPMTSSFIPIVPLKTAVLFLVFNRPDTTTRVFDAIRKAQPSHLYVAADGPRADRKGEAEKVIKVREIATAVDWPCEVKTFFREDNLGCKNAVSGGITWFFQHEEQGIILEDDCLPHPEFFFYCESLLDRYADDVRVSVITGNNFQKRNTRGDGSYYFSRYVHVWGWATWRRAWQSYDGDLSFWPDWKRSKAWLSEFQDSVERRYWEKIFDRMYAKEINTWDYPWTGSVWYHGGLTATPNVNLVSNIGFGADSTHTGNPNDVNASRQTHSLGEIKHPKNVLQDEKGDRYAFDYHYGGRFLRFPLIIIYLPRLLGGFLYRKFKLFSELTA